MNKILIESATEMMTDDKIAKGTIGAGTAAATGTIMDWLPSFVGLTASFVTIIFTLFLLYFHIKKHKMEVREHELRIKNLKEELERRE